MRKIIAFIILLLVAGALYWRTTRSGPAPALECAPVEAYSLEAAPPVSSTFELPLEPAADAEPVATERSAEPFIPLEDRGDAMLAEIAILNEMPFDVSTLHSFE